MEELAAHTEAKKLRGEPTGPLPVPTVTHRRRYDATPSSVAHRPLAPNTEIAEAADTNALAPKPKAPVTNIATPQPPVIQSRQPVEKERNQPRYYPLAQAATTPPAAVLQAPAEEPQQPRSIRPQLQQLPQRAQTGPRAGYFSEDRRDVRPGPAMQHGTYPPSQGSPVLKAQHNVPSVQNQGMAPTLQAEPPHARGALHKHEGPESPAKYYGLTPHAFGHMPQYPQAQSSNPVTPAPRSHSRRSSRTIPSNLSSPVQRMQNPEIDPVNAPRPDPFQSSKVPLQPPSFFNIPQPAPVHSPPKDTARPSSTPAQAPAEPPRQVPAKRSNIMSILNDEPEEPQPRKRLISEQPSMSATPVQSASTSVSQQSNVPISRDEPPIYPQKQHQTRQTYLSHSPHPHQSQATPQTLPPQPTQHSLPPATGRPFSEYPGYPAVSAPSPAASAQDWMARFDPRGQQHQQQISQPSSTAEHLVPRLTSHQSATPGAYMSAASQPGEPVPRLQPSAQQQSQQRQTYNSQLLQQQHTGSVSVLPSQAQHPPTHRTFDDVRSPGIQQPQSLPQAAASPVLHPYSRRTSGQRPPSPIQLSTSSMGQSPHPHSAQQVATYPPGPQGHSSYPHQQSPHLRSNQGTNAPQYSQQMPHLIASPSPHPHHLSQQPPSFSQPSQPHQSIPPLTLNTQQSNIPFGHNTPPPPHMHSTPAPRGTSGISVAAGPGSHPSLMTRSYTPPSVMHPQQHQQHSQPGMPYPSGPMHTQALHNAAMQQQQNYAHAQMHQHQHQQHFHSTRHSGHHRGYSHDSR